MPSLSFDPVAHIYDATRGYPVEVAQRIAQAIETTTGATPATTFLEVGIGTGRIAYPLVDGWQQALHEILRVLLPGGLFLHCWDEYVSSDVLPVENHWMHIVRELGGEIRRPGSSSRSEVTRWLSQQDLQSQESRVVRWKNTITPRQAVEYVTRRLWSSTW